MSAVLPALSKSPERPKHKSKDKPKHKSKGKEKEKEKQKPLSNILVQDTSESNNDEDPVSSNSTTKSNLSSLVPEGSIRLTTTIDAEEFDYDTLKKNDDLELWVMRVPEGIKPKQLSNLTLSLPPPHATTSQRIGSLARKSGTTYDVWSIHHQNTTTNDSPNEIEDPTINTNVGVGGDELFGLSALVLRKKKNGKLFVAPKPITRHLVLTARPALPTPPPSSPEPHSTNTNSIYKSPARYQHPKHLLKHRFIPTGAVQVPTKSEPTRGETDTESKKMEVDQGNGKANDKETRKVVSPEKKKRKADGEEKKAKKAKTAS